ncbi:hypothetical protein [Acetobacterium sp.]|uniref:hypothetical protein n=1 Tax=Acetobacterium sp. TaxID=1872094 RepID=UPI002721764E|nr:hypothetical protein [Acetobacterium sp.]MDO9491102.1 hypothetical protein [Acetobacterium sp.]
MSESTMAIGTRKNGSQYFIPIVEETPAENWADLVAEFSTTKCHSGIFRRQIERVFPLYRVCSKLSSYTRT